MAHYAFLDEKNVVTEVIVGKHEGEDGIDWEEWYGNFRGQICKRTSYSGSIRVRYAGIGFTYDAAHDAFIPPKPDVPCSFDEETLDWVLMEEKPLA